ncbi:MAG: nucleotide sugar dehydrogenase [Candidatus Bathyarchaeota archaeon]|jgi:nucleotide sugar dehydrogenase
MVNSIMNVKPEEIDTVKKREKYQVCIIGCRKEGIFHACLFAQSGFKVTCFDVNRLLVERISKGKSPYLQRKSRFSLKKHVKTGKLKATNDIEQAVSESDVIIITTPVKIDKKGRIDFLKLENMCKQVGLALQQGSLVIIMSTVRPGTTEGLINKTLENVSGLKVNYHFGLAYSPIFLLKESGLEKSIGHKRIVAARHKNSLEAASTIMGTITNNSIMMTDDVKAAETTKLFRSVQHCVNTALANELALFCEKENLDFFQIQNLAQTDTYEMSIQPSIGCQSICEESRLLLLEAEELKAKLRIPSIAVSLNQKALRHAVDLIKAALRSCRKSFRTARISLIGISRTIDAKDLPAPSTLKLAKTLQTKGSKVSLYDPYLSGKKLIDLGYKFTRRLSDAIKGVDCLVLITGHSRFKRLSIKRLEVLGRMPVAVVDLVGILDPEKVETKGLIYRGLGRGVEEK